MNESTLAPLPHPAPHAGHGTGTELWLARHAEVHEDWRGRAYGDLDVPLSEAGLRRSQELAPALAGLAPALVASSPLQRALTLARGITEISGGEPRIAAELKEIHRGAWQGKAVDELYRDHADDVRAFYADPWTWCGHGGESDAALAARAWPLIDSLLETRRSTCAGRLVVVSHYNVIRVLLAGALGISPARSFALRVDPGRLVLLVDAPGGWHLRHTNVHTPGRMETQP